LAPKVVHGVQRVKDVKAMFSVVPEVEEDFLGVVRSLDESETVLEGGNEALEDGPRARPAAAAVGQRVLHLHARGYQFFTAFHLHKSSIYYQNLYSLNLNFYTPFISLQSLYLQHTYVHLQCIFVQKFIKIGLAV
jgi:hypothetical protein